MRDVPPNLKHARLARRWRFQGACYGPASDDIQKQRQPPALATPTTDHHQLAMPTSTGSRLLRFLLSIVIRLRLSVGRIALAFRARFASLWASILTFARRLGSSQIRLRANDVPVPVGNSPIAKHPQIPGHETVKEEKSGTLAALPDPTSSTPFEFDPHPATPDGGSQRYKPRRLRHSDDPSDIPAGQRTLLSALPLLPDGWRRHVHPEGNVIFYHEGLRIFTESNVIRHVKEILFYATKLIQQAMDTDGVTIDELTEIVLNVDENRSWHYYFVDHRHRLLFWVHPVKPRDDLHIDLQGITGYSHIRYLVEARYWSHCEYYPHNRALPEEVFDRLRGMLNYAKTDMMTADSSTSPFTQDELNAFLDLVNSLKDDKKISDPHSIWVIARLMGFFTEDQFLNFCGQSCARLNADTPLFGQQTWNRGIIFNIVNVFLLGSPNEHAVRLQRVWVDGTIILPRWKDFINRLTTELGRYPIFSTVMLAVNISFLAVPGVITAGSPASPIEIIIYCSVVSTIGSIIFSFALSNVYSDPGLMDAGPAGGSHEDTQSEKMGNGMSCNHAQSSDCLPRMVIFGPKELVTIVTLGVECYILVLFGVMSGFVMQLFSRNDDVDAVDTPEEYDPPLTELQHDLERGSVKCCTFYGR
ncbi:hypothetical protein J3R82DRAFT_8280 [Butyriboletus roseoflavus]|nr:hypothetical protein J3R82DRAFT_8280 [Butyriboletus roseoflavus]